jgi:hypothetical protein
VPSVQPRGAILRLVACAAVLLGGCASFDNAKRPEVFELPEAGSGFATIVLSTGSADKCVSHATNLRIYKASATYSLYSITESLAIDNYAIKSDFTDHHGYLHVVKLPAGSYYFATGLLQPFASPLHIPKTDFVIAAGDVAYFGEFYLTRACGLSTEGGFRDRSERDIPMLEARNPAIAKAINRKFIPKTTGVAWPPPEPAASDAAH